MENIIPLGDYRAQMPRRTPREPVEAKILLFTGVRYERLDMTTTRRPGTGSKRAKNK